MLGSYELNILSLKKNQVYVLVFVKYRNYANKFWLELLWPFWFEKL